MVQTLRKISIVSITLLIVFAFQHANCQTVDWRICKAGQPNKSLLIQCGSEGSNDVTDCIGRYLFKSEKEVIERIVQSFDPHIKPTYIPAYYFVCDYTWSTNRPLDEREKYRDVTIFMNSLGFGFCGSKAQALSDIWNLMGYKTRVWDLNGHIVPEIWTQGRWEVWDPTYHVFYFDSSGSACSVAQLEKNPRLVDKPYFPANQKKTIWMRRMGFGKKLAKIYASTDDNKILYESVPKTPSERINPFILPPDAQVIFPVYSGLPLYSRYHGEITRLPDYAELAVYIPPGQTGKLDIPLMLHGVCASSLQFIVDNKNLVLTGKNAVWYGAGFSPPTTIVLKENTDGAWFYFLVNPKMLESLEKNDAGKASDSSCSFTQKWVKPALKNRINILYLSDLKGRIKTEKVFRTILRRIFIKRYAYVPQK